MSFREETKSEETKSRLIGATLRSISDNGLADTTTSKISGLANVSKATLHHYFDTKDNLLHETMLHLLRLIGEQSRVRMASASTPRAKIMTIVECVSLGYAENPRQVSLAWFAFWAQASQAPTLGRLMNIYSQRLRSNLRFFLKQLFRDELPDLEDPWDHTEHVADGIAALIHGTFVSLSIGEGKLTPASASALIIEYLDMVIAAQRRGAQA